MQKLRLDGLPSVYTTSLSWTVVRLCDLKPKPNILFPVALGANPGEQMLEQNRAVKNAVAEQEIFFEDY